MSCRRTFVALLFVSGCGTSTERESLTPADAGAAPDASTPPDPSFGDGGVVVSPPRDDCPEESKFIYVMDAGGMLRRFDPPTWTFSALGSIDCGQGVGTPSSMAVARDSTAWVLFTSGKLFKVSTKDASCSPTTFTAKADWTEFGMGFVSDVEDGKTETLYVASAKALQVGKIALDTMTLTPLGPLSISSRMELTGTGSAQLFGLLAPPPDDPKVWSIAELSKASGALFSRKKQEPITEPSNLNFAFAAWGGDFYSFIGLRVYRHDTKNNEIIKMPGEVSFTIVGAGVSTCAPHAIVK